MVHSIHDSGYRKLFSNKTIFKQLLETFVAQEWVKDIDFSSCKALNRTFVSNEYKERETDLIQEVNIKGKKAFIYILIEFQSNVQKFMAVRVLHYITSLYIYYLENNKKVKKIPAIFPIVLYNGDDKWTAPENISELIENHIPLGEYGINFKYFKIVENSFDPDFLLKAKNIVSTLFYTEAYFDISGIQKAFEELFEHEEDKQAMSIFFNWYEQLHKNDKLDSNDFNEVAKIYKEKSEVKSMLVTALRKQKALLKAEGRIEGLEEGRAEGIEEGQIKNAQSYVIKLLNKKIGKIPKKIEKIILSCKNIEKLDKITDCIFEIESYDEVNSILNS